MQYLKHIVLSIALFLTVACSVVFGAVNNYLKENTPYTNYFIIPNKDRAKITGFDYNKSKPRVDYRKVKVGNKEIYVKYYLPELSYTNFNFYFFPILPNKDIYDIPMDVQNALSTRSIGFKEVELKGKFRSEVLPYYNTLESIVIGVTEEELKEILIPNLFIQLNHAGGCNKKQAEEDAKVFQFSLCLIDGINFGENNLYLEKPKFYNEIIEYNTNWLNEKEKFNNTGKTVTNEEVRKRIEEIIASSNLVNRNIDIIERNNLVKRYMLYLIRGYAWYCSDKYKDVELINQCVFSSMVAGPKLNVLSPTGNKFGRYGNDFINFIPTTYKIIDGDKTLEELRGIYKVKGHISPLHALNITEFMDPKVMCLDLSNQDIGKLNCFTGDEWTKHKFKRFNLEMEEINTVVSKYNQLNSISSHDGGLQTDIIPTLPHVKLELVDKYGRNH